MITFGSGFIVITCNWISFKEYISNKVLSIQCDESDELYTLFAVDGNLVYRTTIIRGDVGRSDVTQEENDEYKADYETNYKSKANGPVSPIASDGRPRVANEKTTEKRSTIYTHNWTEPTSWYTTSSYIVEEVATDAGNHISYQLSNTNIIDTYHGKVTGEDYLYDSDGYSYRVQVWVNNVLKTERDPHFGSGGDYTINYTSGQIIFLQANQPGDSITCTYHYMVDSDFIIRPDAGTKLIIDFVEVQFTTDIIIADSCTFQPYGYVDVFAPQLVGMIPSGTKIPLGSPLVYKTIMDYQNDAVKAYATYPALGGTDWRGCTVPVVVFDWDYQASTVLSSAAGMEIHLKLVHDTPFGGSYASATFYCLVNNE